MSTLDENLQTELIELLKEGRKIEAIKRLRNASGMDLKDAKETIDSLGVEAEAGGGCGAAALFLGATPALLWLCQ